MTENRVVASVRKGQSMIRSPKSCERAVEAEFETFLASAAELVLPDGRQRMAARQSATHLSQSSAPPCTRRMRRPSPSGSVSRSPLACCRRRPRRARR
jgi:hypothetical protein